MQDIILLGTGTPIPDPARCGSGTALVGDGTWVLVDCGRGITTRASEAGLDLTRLAAVVLTHHHSDHVSDLPTLAITRWVAGGAGALTVVAPRGPCARFVDRCLEAYEDEAFHSQGEPDGGARPAIDGRDFRARDHPSVVFEEGGWSVMGVLVDHHPIEAAVGYRVSQGGHTVAVSGDTAVCDGMLQLSMHADVLIHETLDVERTRPDLLEWNAGAPSVGGLAREACVGRLVLTHLLPIPAGAEDEQRFVDQARSGGYAGPIDVARDLMAVPLP